jgi:hypothetical protein
MPLKPCCNISATLGESNLTESKKYLTDDWIQVD